VRLGLISHELHEVSYRIRVLVDGESYEMKTLRCARVRPGSPSSQ
jgi:hypothetical protein